jgi:two-component system phosphate regulon sensor histidine kinase PhoR
MKKRVFNIIAILTAIALSGIIVTQSFWVKQALDTKNEQFDQNALLGLKRVVNQLMALQNDSVTALKYLALENDCDFHSQFIHSLSPQLIGEMIDAEFQDLELCDTYHYGIYNKESTAFILSSQDDFEARLLSSEHQMPISCIFQENQYILTVYFLFQRQFVFNKMQIYIFLSGLFMLIVIAGFWFTASSFIRQKKLSEMKTDFVNNMTHELKTPIATISVSSEMLMNNEVQNSGERIRKYAKIIYNENERLKNQVDQVLQVAMLDQRKYDLKRSNTDVHDIIQQSTERFQLSIQQQDGDIQLRLNAAQHIVNADSVHISNAINNLIDNAIKYSPQKPQITISTHSTKKGVFLTIQDKGIGIADENTKHIFKQFHRIPTGDIHNVKGFGIGLYYVKTIVEAHGGKISLNSKLGKGSSFTVFLPYYNDTD